ncbi:MAG TPA: hypothetical protein VF532_24090 [Candidatus Angelobacter sp.]
MKNTNYRNLVSGLLAVWFAVVLSASALHAFRSDASPPRALGLAVALPLVLFAIWFAASPEFREFLLSLSPRTLTLLHSWRVAGYTFLVLYTYGILPGIFALPAGWGDIAIGATAPLVAFKLANPRHRGSFMVWQLLGMADLVIAVTTGTLARLIDPGAVATGAMTVLPLSLIPTFAVPLLLMLHAIAIAQARRWPALEHAGATDERHVTA